MLEASQTLKTIVALYDEDRIKVLVPMSILTPWLETEQVGMQAEQRLDNGETLKILIEKDFKCLTIREGEDESDAFPHPQEGSVVC